MQKAQRRRVQWRLEAYAAGTGRRDVEGLKEGYGGPQSLHILANEQAHV